MGWTRNYHTHCIEHDAMICYPLPVMPWRLVSAWGDCVCLLSTPVISVWGNLFLDENFEKALVDACDYVCDVGDNWLHQLQCVKVIPHDSNATDNENSSLFGKVAVLDGSMRCPVEDGEGGTYQEQVLDLWQARRDDPSNQRLAVKNACAIHARLNAMNACGVFYPTEFSVQKCQAAVQAALQSSLSFRHGNKQPVYHLPYVNKID